MTMNAAPIPPPEPAAELSVATTGPLAAFEQARVLTWADVHVARRLARLASTTDPSAVLAAALTVRAARTGSACIDLTTQEAQTFVSGEERVDTADLEWPTPERWLDSVRASPLVGVEPDGPRRPLRLNGSVLYLDRYWRDEELVRTMLQRRATHDSPVLARAALNEAVQRLSPEAMSTGQREACIAVATSWTTVIAGGPGTGKTTTIGRLLLVLRELGMTTIALAAPTGKAAVRLSEAVQTEFARYGHEDDVRLEAHTLHKLLGLRPGPGPQRAPEPLPHEVIVVDEMSMVSLPLMARLMASLRPDTRLVLVGDPEQLASVETGAVLADLTEASGADSPRIVRLSENFRYGSGIASVAEAISSGNPSETMAALHAPDPGVNFVETDLATPPDRLRDVVTTQAEQMSQAAIRGDGDAALAALAMHRLLCGHRGGPYGVAVWNGLAHQWTTTASLGHSAGEWYPGRPVLITENAPDLGLYNGDTGVVIATATGPRAAFAGGRLIPVHLIDAVVTAHAMTVHKAQGSQFDDVSLILPPPGSPLLTRQLLYTAVTRAQSGITIYGHQQAIVEAVTHPAVRASGLRSRL